MDYLPNVGLDYSPCNFIFFCILTLYKCIKPNICIDEIYCIRVYFKSAHKFLLSTEAKTV